MLLRLRIKNFLSFYEETEFNMFPNPKRTSFPNHIYTDVEVPLLKHAAIYGANGSGKSNFIKAIQFLEGFVLKEDFLENIDIDDYRFQLVEQAESAIQFEIEFYQDNNYFIYSVEITSDEISEELVLSGLGRLDDKLLFSRKGSEIKSDYITNIESTKELLKMNPHSSVFPLNRRFPVLSSQEVKSAIDWFGKKLDIITINATLPSLIDLMSTKPELLKFTNEVFRNIGVGINSIEIKETPFDEWLATYKNAESVKKFMEGKQLDSNRTISRMENNRTIFNVSLKEGKQVVEEFIFDQIGQLGYHKGMKMSAQSDGTVRLLTLIPAIYGAILSDKVVVVDEIDNSIHPKLMNSLLRYFSEKETKGQLIFTTHDTHLLNQQELLRPDEMWLAEKENGNTKMYSINDFKIHHTINIENGYMDGRFGAIPSINEFE